jgi:hypothetical protein
MWHILLSGILTELASFDQGQAVISRVSFQQKQPNLMAGLRATRSTPKTLIYSQNGSPENQGGMKFS